MDVPEKIIEAIKLHEHTEDVELVKADVQYSRDGIGETIARAVIGKYSSKVRNYFLRWDQQKEKFEVLTAALTVHPCRLLRYLM